MRSFPLTVTADGKGTIGEQPGLAAAGRSGNAVYPLATSALIPLPQGSRLYFLPGRRALGFSPRGGIAHPDDDSVAVAAFLPPGYVALSLSAFHAGKHAPLLPLFCYCAVCWYRNGFYVPARRVDADPKHLISCSDMKKAQREISRWIRQYPHNRLVAHHGLTCVKEYGCPNAVNLFLRRWEAPIAVSVGCNAACQGCISRQESKFIPAPQSRIGFIPTVDEIVEIAVPHLKKAAKALISFGQGCEGEPLLQCGLIEAAIRAIRKRTTRGTIHLNTNGSLPAAVKRLAAAGLDSIRISLNSARPALYSAYYRCRGYSFDDVRESLRIARKAGLWTSINYLIFPGVTDAAAEYSAFSKLLQEAKPQMIQWRNLNIDPDWYMKTVAGAWGAKRLRPMGITTLMKKIRADFPEIRFGYFNPPINFSAGEKFIQPPLGRD
jgi:pyruvate-formate lyase-activating enzyme